MRSTHNASQGFVMTHLAGSSPYLCLCCLLTWHVRQFLTCDRMVCLIYFQYIAVCNISSRQGCPGCYREWWYQLTAWFWRTLGMTILPSLHKTGVTSTSWMEYLSVLHSFFKTDCPSGLVQFPLLLMGKIHLLHCDWQTPCWFCLGDHYCPL